MEEKQGESEKECGERYNQALTLFLREYEFLTIAQKEDLAQ